MPENSWVTRLGPGHGEAVVLDINPVLNRAAQQERNNIALARIKAKEEAEKKKKEEEELYKLTNQAMGEGGYLTPFVNQEYQALQDEIRQNLTANKPIDVNQLRTRYNALQAAAQQGKVGSDVVKSRFPDYKTQQFIDVPAFERSYMETLKSKYDAHKKAGGNIATFRFDPEQVAEETLTTTTRPIYDVKSYGKNFRDMIQTQNFQEPLQPGRVSQSVRAQPVFQMQNGLPTKDLDYDKVAGMIMNDRLGARMVQQSFETALSDPDNEYFKLDFENKNKFGANTPQYQQSKQALMQRYAKNDFLSDAGIAPEAFVYEPGQQYTRPLAGGGSKKKEVVFTQGPQTFLTVGQIPTTVKEAGKPDKTVASFKSHDTPVSYFSAPVKEVPLEISLTYDRDLTPQVAKGTSGSYTVATDNIGVTAQPFTTAKIQSGDKSFKPGIGLNIANLRNQLGKGPYTVTYSDGTKETIATLPALLNSKAVQFDPMYVFTPAIQLSSSSPLDRKIAETMGYDLSVTGTKAVLDKRLIKARNAPELETAVLRSKGAPTKEQWEAQKQAAIQQAKDALLKQVEGKPIGSSAQRFKKPAAPVKQQKAADNLFAD